MTALGDARLPARFWSKVAAEGGCWVWQRCKTSAGYGQVWHNEKVRYSHIVSYETFVGPVPGGLELDHVCRNRACCNPCHLEPVTHRVNVARGCAGEARGAQQRAKTHCPSGHEYAGGNLYMHRGKHRYCRTCISARTKKSRLRAAIMEEAT